jgi:nucleotide-binding universal stress UspA family protein
VVVKILVAVDFSSSSRQAAREVTARPWPPGSTVLLLHVMEPMDLVSGQIFAPDFFKARSDAAETAIASLAEELATNDMSVRTEVVPGSPRADIAACAVRFEADLIVLGSRGLGALGRFFLGSIAKAVLRSAPCSVEVVRRTQETTREPKGMKLLVAVDGSVFSQDAARAVSLRPWPAGSEARVVSVAQTGARAGFYWVTYSQAQEIDDLKRREARQIAETARELVEPSGLPITTSVLEGDPKSALIEECERWGADLALVGSHGLRGLERLLLGSVSEAVATHAHCSVEVVRAHAARAHSVSAVSHEA